MAERRMFSRSVVDSDAFSDMPLSAQALYFHLGMRADDDGFVNCAQQVVRMIGAAKDDLSLLFAKGFLIPFQNGVCVVTHWKQNNYIKSDRYHPSIYAEYRGLLTCGESGAYRLNNDMDTICIQNGSNLDPQYRLGKDRLDKNRPPIPPKGAGRFDTFWKAYPRKVGKGDAERAFRKIKPDKDLLGDMLRAIEWQRTSEQWSKDGGRYIPYPATWLNQRRWEDEPDEPKTDFGIHDISGVLA